MPHNPPRPVAGKGARPCGLSRRERDERGGVVPATRVCRPTPAFSASTEPPQKRREGLKQRASARRALGPFRQASLSGRPAQRACGREPMLFRGSGSQGSDRPAGGHVGKALRASLVLGGGCPSIPGRQPPVRHLVRSVCLSPKHTSPSVSGRQPGAPPAHPTLNRLRVSAGGERTCSRPRFSSQFTREFLYISGCGADRIRGPKTVRSRRFGRRLQRPRSGAFHRPNR